MSVDNSLPNPAETQLIEIPACCDYAEMKCVYVEWLSSSHFDLNYLGSSFQYFVSTNTSLLASLLVQLFQY